MKLHAQQEKIVAYLSDVSSAPGGDIAEHIGLSVSATKSHIEQLRAHGVLEFEDRNVGLGRPKRYYQLSEEGEDVFPRQYAWLSTSLLDVVASTLGPYALVDLMEKLAEQVVASVSERFVSAKDQSQRVKVVNQVMNELGYRSSVKQSDVRKLVVIEATNCVYHSVAQKHPALCQFDRSFLEKALDMKVKQESCIAQGDDVCRFCLK